MAWRILGSLLAAVIALEAEAGMKVVGVTDGDTLEVAAGRTVERVRLWGIDCPEKGQAFGKAAKGWSRVALAFGCQGRTHTIKVKRCPPRVNARRAAKRRR